MKNIVILGAGTGGALVANLLSHRLDLRQWQITVIDRGSLHVYQPGLLFLPVRHVRLSRHRKTSSGRSRRRCRATSISSQPTSG